MLKRECGSEAQVTDVEDDHYQAPRQEGKHLAKTTGCDIGGGG